MRSGAAGMGLFYPIRAPSTLAKAAGQKLMTCRIRALTYTIYLACIRHEKHVDIITLLKLACFVHISSWNYFRPMHLLL